VIGGFIPGPHGIDSIIVGYYRGNDLVYVARVRNGFVPATRRTVYEKLRPLITDTARSSICRKPDAHDGARF
jgi:ATP-dependent DNA ligase